jgi:hypothetical protein
MLEVIVVPLERSKSDSELDRDIRFQYCTFGEDLEYSHVLSIQILSFLRNPAEIEFAL